MTPEAARVRWRRDPAALHRRTARGPLVLAPDADEPIVLTGTAAAVWDLLDVPRDEHVLADLLATAAADVTIGRTEPDPATTVARLGEALRALVTVEVVERLP